jgi:hypothetical protein
MTHDSYKAWIDAMPIEDVRRRIERLERKLSDLQVLERLYADRHGEEGEHHGADGEHQGAEGGAWSEGAPSELGAPEAEGFGGEEPPPQEG